MQLGTANTILFSIIDQLISFAGGIMQTTAQLMMQLEHS